jgi:hypothetical protein
LSANVVPLRFAESAKTCCTSFLFAAALMGGFSVDLMFQIIARRHVILPIDS